MDRTITLGVLAACAGLAACGGGNDPVVVAPTIDDLDSALPFGTTDGIAEDMLLADLNGVSDNQATITFNADNTYTITLPGAAGPVTISQATVITPVDNLDLGTTSRTYNIVVGGLDASVEVHLGEDSLGNDLFILSQIEEDAFGTPSLSTMSFVVFGDETATAALPTGDGFAYTGGFVSEAFDVTTGASVAQYGGDTAITANFGLGTVDLTFTDTNEGTGVVFQATGLTVTDAQYGGVGVFTSGGTGGTNFVGDVIGAFYGAGAEATAGTFNALDDSGGAGTEIEIIGGFTGFR